MKKIFIRSNTPVESAEQTNESSCGQEPRRKYKNEGRNRMGVEKWCNYDAAFEAATHCDRLTDFIDIFANAHAVTLKNKWYPHFPWLITDLSRFKEGRFWTIPSCKIAAGLSENHIDFMTKYPDAYEFAVKMNILNSLVYDVEKPLRKEKYETERINKIIDKIKLICSNVQHTTNENDKSEIEQAFSEPSSVVRTINYPERTGPVINNDAEQARFNEIKVQCDKQRTYNSLLGSYPRSFYEALIRGWLHYMGLNEGITRITRKNCITTASTCFTIEEFDEYHHELYVYACNNGFIDEVKDSVGKAYEEARRYFERYPIENYTIEEVIDETNDKNALPEMVEFLGSKECQDAISDLAENLEVDEDFISFNSLSKIKNSLSVILSEKFINNFKLLSVAKETHYFKTVLEHTVA